MADNASDLLASVLDKTADLIAGAQTNDKAHEPTPCSELDVAQLTEHMTGWAAKFAARLDGSGQADGAPGGDPAEAFRSSAATITRAYRSGAPGTEQLPVGMLLMEFIAHGWDLATATGQQVPYTPAEATAALDAGRRMLEPKYRGPDKS